MSGYWPRARLVSLLQLALRSDDIREGALGFAEIRSKGQRGHGQQTTGQPGGVKKVKTLQG
jgi:hypothetical protein